ncbi:hypothetical protein [Ferrovibrio sp.]|uniref:hypothetical protein n=1 Tax=Ferrovibrio sp. TaxID=1917215 RepID=UPI00311E7D68
MVEGMPSRRLPILLLAVLLAAPAALQSARAQDRQVQGSDPGATEDAVAGSKTVRGHYRAGEIQADWEAAVRNGRVERIVEWRDYGAYGNANVVFNFFGGRLMHYGESSQRRAGQAGTADSFRRVSLNLNFAAGRFTSGTKTVDGIDTELDEADITGAVAQSRAALQRLEDIRSAWAGDGRGGTTHFSLQSLPQPEPGPTAEARRLAGGGGLVAFRCDNGLNILLGSSGDRLVVDGKGMLPVVLHRQPRGARYDYMSPDWGAERQGDTIRLSHLGVPSVYCGVISAEAAPAEIPSPAASLTPMAKPPAPPLPLMPPATR